MRISTFAQNTLVKQNILRLQNEMLRAQNQLATGKTADTLGDLGSSASLSLSLRNDLNRIAQSGKTIAIAETRMEVMQSSFERIHENAEGLSLDALTGAFENDVRLPTLQVTAEAMLQETIGLMNRSLAGRFLFGGSKTDAPPVEDADTILNGDSATGRYGLLQQIANRARADQVDDVASPGGLDVTTDTGLGTLTIADTSKDGFGFTIESVEVSSGITVTTTESATDKSVTLSGLAAVAADATVTLVVRMPDGETAEIEVTADGDFGTGLANLANNLSEELVELAQSQLAAASAIRAASDFFDTVPPKIVTFDAGGAPSLVEDSETSPKAVWWYAGSTGDTPRAEVAAELDEGTTIRYGVRADEAAIRDTLKHLALLSAVTFEDDEVEMFRALADKTGRGLQSAMDRTETLINEIGAIQEVTLSVEARNESVKTLVQTQLGTVEDADAYEISTRLLSYETQLQATYQITGRLQSLSLVNVLSF